MWKKIANETYYHLVNAGPLVLVGTKTEQQINFTPVAWISPLNDEPPLITLAIAADHFAAQALKKNPQLTINLVDKKLLPLAWKCGKVSGKEIDKLKKFSIKTCPSEVIEVPGLADSPAIIEGRIIDSREYAGVVLFIVRVLHSKVAKSLYDDYWLTDRAKIIHHVGGKYFACLGKRFVVAEK